MTVVEKTPGRKGRFYFYATGPGGASTVVETMTLASGVDFTIDDVRIMLSDSHVSAIQAALRLSSILGTAYNVTLFSQAMVGISNYFWQPSQTLYCNAGDQAILTMIVSAANTWGIYISGWSVVDSRAA
jgi:hypothetical protein